MWTDLSLEAVASRGVVGEGCGREDQVRVRGLGDENVARRSSVGGEGFMIGGVTPITL
jgi:hypothetical protein